MGATRHIENIRHDDNMLETLPGNQLSLRRLTIQLGNPSAKTRWPNIRILIDHY